MYCVYWWHKGEARGQEFEDLKLALELCEECRNAGYRFVTMAVENPNHVGKMGVAAAGPDYEWVKRRDSIYKRDK